MPSWARPPDSDVERRHDLGEQAGIPVCDAGDERAECDRLGLAGDESEPRVALEHRVLRRREALHLEPVVHQRELGAADFLGRLARSPRASAPSDSGPPGSVKLTKWIPNFIDALRSCGVPAARGAGTAKKLDDARVRQPAPSYGCSRPPASCHGACGAPPGHTGCRRPAIARRQRGSVGSGQRNRRLGAIWIG